MLRDLSGATRSKERQKLAKEVELETVLAGVLMTNLLPWSMQQGEPEKQAGTDAGSQRAHQEPFSGAAGGFKRP